MTVLGVVLSVACRTGDCGRTTLTGDTGVAGTYVIRVIESLRDPFVQEFGIHVSCRMCHSYSNECTYVRATSVGGTGGASSKHDGDGNVVWSIPRGAPPERAVATLIATATCPAPTTSYYNRPGGVAMQWLGYDKYAGNPAITVTSNGGVWGTVPAWREYYPWGWELKILADGSGPGATATPVNVSLSYPEAIVLDGRGKEAQVIYDIEGNGGLLVVMDGVPEDLACKRRGSGVVVNSGTGVSVGPGDAITCTNTKVKPGQTAGIIAVTAMIK